MTSTIGRILIIDDQPDILDVLQEYFTGCGYEVLTALDGRTGLDLAARHEPDVVVLDIRMPGLSGVEVLQQMRERWPSLPVIMLTALEDLALAKETLRRGALDYVRKPFEVDHLHRVVTAARLRPTTTA